MTPRENDPDETVFIAPAVTGPHDSPVPPPLPNPPDEGDAKAPPPDHRQIIEIRNRRWYSFMTFLRMFSWIVVVVLLVIVAIAWTRSPALIISVLAFVIIGSILTAVISQSRLSARIGKALGAADHQNPLGDRLRDAVANGRIRPNWLLHDKPAKALMQIATPGTIIRVARGKTPSAVRSINMPFEPRPLNEGLEQFWDLEHAVRTDQPRGTGAEAAANQEYNAFMRRVHRGVALAGGWSIMLLGVVVIGFVAYSIYTRHTLINSGYTYIEIKVLVAMAVFARAVLLPAMGNHWLIVPAGVVIRAPKRGARPEHIRFYRANESKLVAYQRASSQSWIVRIVKDQDPDSILKTTLTTNELNLLLGAWMSKEPPPPEEYLTQM